MDADEFEGARMIIFEASTTTLNVEFKINRISEVCQCLDPESMMVTPEFYVIYFF